MQRKSISQKDADQRGSSYEFIEIFENRQSAIRVRAINERCLPEAVPSMFHSLSGSDRFSAL